MSILESIPNEICTEILSYLRPAALARVSRLSQHMNAVSKSILYKSIMLTTSRISGRTSLQLILQILLSPASAELAKCVRSLHLQWDYENTPLHTQLPANSDQFATTALCRGVTDLPASQDGQLLLLLNLVDRLQVLTLAPPSGSTDPFSLLTATGTRPLRLDHLREFHCSTTGISPLSLLSILHLPNIRTVAAHLTSADLPPHTPATSRTSPITTLRLTCTALQPPILAQILLVPTALHSFALSAQYTYTAHPLSDFCTLVQPLRATLEHLHVDLSGIVHNLPTQQQLGIGSFREWPALRGLQASLSLLLGHGDGLQLADVLPAGLRELDIRRDRFWSVRREMDALVQLLRGGTEVRVLAVGIGRVGMRSMGGLVRMCEDMGVTLIDNGAAGGGSEMVSRRTVRVMKTCCRRG